MSLTYSAAVEQTITAGEQIHQIVNGTATTEVNVEDGSKVPSIRKALLDNFYFKDPIAWQVGQTENVFNQLRKFTDGSWWYAPSATASNPVSMGSTPVGNSLWKIYDFDAIGKLTPQIRESLRRSYAEAGRNLVAGSFEAGGTLVNANDVLLQERTGKVFSGPSGTVAAGTNPVSGGFVDVSFSAAIHTTTVQRLSSGVYKPGDTVVVSDRDYGRFKVIAGGVPDGFGVISAGNGNTAEFVPINGYGSLKNFGAVENTNVTQALEAGMNYLKLSTLVIPSGSFDINGAFCRRNNLTIIGEKGNLLRQVQPFEGNKVITFINGANESGAFNPNADTTRVENITVTGVNFYRATRQDMTSASDPLQSQHFMSFIRPKNIKVSECSFTGYQGDAVSFTGNETVSIPEHIRVVDNIFDGVDNKNRNAISLITGRDVKILRNKISNTANKYQPGGIDCEPNPYNYNILEDIEISDNIINNAGGTGGCVVIFNRSTHANTSVRDIKILRNKLVQRSPDGGTGGGVSIYVPDYLGTKNIEISENTIDADNRVINIIAKVSGLNITDNVEIKGGASLSVRCPLAGHSQENIKISRNNLSIYGTDGVLKIRTVDGLVIEGNTIHSPSNTPNITIGSSDETVLKNKNITISGNKITKATGVGAVIAEGLFEGASCVFDKNFPNVVNSLPAWVSDNSSIYVSSFNGDTLPVDFPIGESTAALNTATAGNVPNVGGKQGVLKCFKLSNDQPRWVYQRWIPVYTLADSTRVEYHRNADATGTNWSPWIKVTGV